MKKEYSGNCDFLVIGAGIAGLYYAIKISNQLKAHKIPPSILTLLDDGTVGVKAIDDKKTVIFYPTKTIKDTIDGMWVSGLPDSVNLIVSGQEYISIGEIIN